MRAAWASHAAYDAWSSYRNQLKARSRRDVSPAYRGRQTLGWQISSLWREPAFRYARADHHRAA